MSSNKTFQDVILTLQQYWADLGCVIWQPHHTEVGAGTMNPATAIRVLGPEPWNVAYVEPSFRPADGRYGENPNRWQQYFQFQVILKPDPGNPQDLYLDSLRAIGIDPLQHDIRFVEDNWESPPLGAWGLGWEVWMDGQEITQFTYFQQSGGHALDPVSVEITYGLERIVMPLQGARNFLEIDWDQHIKYGEILLAREQQHSTYNFELADIERVRTLFDEYEAEALVSIDKSLTFPAHDYVLKCSHAFNLLDTRGAIGVAERAALFSRMRVLSSKVANLYLQQRETLGFPWMNRSSLQLAVEPRPELTSYPPPTAPADFLLEIGTEELPSKDFVAAINGLENEMEEILKENRLSHDAVQIWGTPRRLVVFVGNLAPEQSEATSTAKGPPADRAFDENGNPTKAAIGFARSRGVPVEALKVDEVDGGEYVIAEVIEPNQSASDVLQEALPQLIGSLRFEKSMRWNSSEKTFSRPIRWYLALHGNHVVPFQYAGVESNRLTYGLRFHEPITFEVEEPGDYFTFLEERGIILDQNRREDLILQELHKAATRAKGELLEDASLLLEVTNLVEKPTVLCGSFHEEHLALPRDVLVTVMKSHQRYFPLEGEGTLLPKFLFVRNGGGDFSEIVIHGNEQVVGARFADAAFFIAQDERQRLEDYVPQLATLTFQTELGSMLDKVSRLQALAESLASDLNLNHEQIVIAMRAAYLCKADLVTRIVVEMTSLQGIMGREYANKSGEDAAVADAIFEHYLPRFAGDSIPTSREGLLVGISDRLDTLMGLFSIGLTPSGTSDPYALRRTAIGLIHCLVGTKTTFDLAHGLSLAKDQLGTASTDDALLECLAFIKSRQRTLLLGENISHDVADAILAEQGTDPYGVVQGTKALTEWTERSNWLEILQAYARCARITRNEEIEFEFDPALMVEEATKGLYRALRTAEQNRGESGSIDDFLAAFVPMIPAINQFFDEVLVMAEDRTLRSNRLRLLEKVVALAEGAADLTYLEGF